MAEELGRRRFPCISCPWRRDTAGRIGYDNLAAYATGTCGSPGAEAPLGAEMFACHTSNRRPQHLCAGWLAVAGYHHLTVRLAVLEDRLPAAALDAGESWPALFGSYEEMAAAHGVRHA